MLIDLSIGKDSTSISFQQAHPLHFCTAHPQKNEEGYL